MSDIRKRTGAKGTTYQVRYPNKSAKSGYSYKTFETLKEARAFREDSKARSSIMAGHPDIKTVPDAVDKWLKICEKEGLNGREPVTLYTLKNYRYRAEIISAYRWPAYLHELRTPDIVEFRSWLLTMGYSRDLASKVLATLQSVFKEMALRGFLGANIATGINLRTESRYDLPVQIPSKAELLALLRAADRLSNSKNLQIARTWERYRPMLYLAADSGMRPQEYLGAPISALRDNGIEVTQAISGDGYSISVTKTRAGRRFIELGKDTIDMVRFFAKNNHSPNKHNLLFPSQNGRWQCRRNWQRRGFSAACLEAGLVTELSNGEETVLKPMYRPYDLRHFYASMLIEKKVNLKKIQTLMGHAKIETTLNVYGHLLDDPALQVEQRGILDDLRGDCCGDSVATAL